jgi:hypothetical protein
MPPVNLTSSPCSIGLRKYITRWWVISKPPRASTSFVLRPFAFNQLDLQPFLLEEAVFHGTEDRRFAGDANVADPYFVTRAGAVALVTAVGAQCCAEDKRTVAQNRTIFTERSCGESCRNGSAFSV